MQATYLQFKWLKCTIGIINLIWIFLNKDFYTRGNIHKKLKWPYNLLKSQTNKRSPCGEWSDCPLWMRGGNSLSRIISPPHPLVCICVHHLLQPIRAAHQSWTTPTPLAVWWHLIAIPSPSMNQACFFTHYVLLLSSIFPFLSLMEWDNQSPSCFEEVVHLVLGKWFHFSSHTQQPLLLLSFVEQNRL